MKWQMSQNSEAFISLRPLSTAERLLRTGICAARAEEEAVVHGEVPGGDAIQAMGWGCGEKAGSVQWGENLEEVHRGGGI